MINRDHYSVIGGERNIREKRRMMPKWKEIVPMEI
jgi:hypothetical protein